jgi:cell wall assembly regulator SMI1
MNLQQLQAAYQEWLGEPNYVLAVTASDEQEISNTLELLYYFSEDDEEDPTWIATAGLANCTTSSICDRAELVMYVPANPSHSEYENLGQGFANLVWDCLARGLYFAPNQVIRNISLPLFERMNCVFVTDWWGYEFPEWLPNIEPGVRILKIVLIYETEAQQLDNIELIFRTEVLEQTIGHLSNPLREPVRLLTEATKKIWEHFEKWCRSNAPLICRNLRQGASSEEIKTLEERIGLTLPEDFSTFLMVHNGAMWFDSYEYIGTEQIYETWFRMNQIQNKGSFANRKTDSRSLGIIKNIWWDSHWIPFAEDGCGNLHCIDLAPDVNGTIGQVIYWEKIQGPLPSGCQSFFAWFRDMDQGLGKYYVVGEEGRIEEKL